MSIPTYIVNNSTSIVLIDSSRITEDSYALVYLSNVDYAGTVVTVRDSIGEAGPTKQILLSTTEGLQFQDGSFSTLINQPFGFMTFTSAPPFTWHILNIYAFANTSEAAYVRNFNTDVFYTSTLYASAGGFFSTLSVGTTLFVGETLTVSSFSTLGNALIRGSLTVSSFSTLGDAAIGGSLTVSSFSTLGDAVIVGSLTVSSFSTLGNAAIRGSLTVSSFSTLGNAAIEGSLTLKSIIFNTNNCLISSIRDDITTISADTRRFVYWDASLGELVTGGPSATIYGNSYFRIRYNTNFITDGAVIPLVTNFYSTIGLFITKDTASHASLQLHVQNAGATSRAIRIHNDRTTTFYGGISTSITSGTIIAGGLITANRGITIPTGQTISGSGFTASVTNVIPPVDLTQTNSLRIAKTGTLTSGLVLDVSGSAAFTGKVGIGRATVGTTNALDVTGDFSVTGGGHIQGGATCGTTDTNSGVERLRVYGSIYATGDISAFSDARLKTNISTIENALEKINALRGVYYTPLSNLSTQKIGVIAQEIEQQFPQLVQTDSSEQKMKAVAYGNITAILIEGIKTLTQRVTALEATVSTLQG